MWHWHESRVLVSQGIALRLMGHDKFHAGRGRDFVFVSVGSEGERDVINCGPGSDYLEYVEVIGLEDVIISCEKVRVITPEWVT